MKVHLEYDTEVDEFGEILAALVPHRYRDALWQVREMLWGEDSIDRDEMCARFSEIMADNLIDDDPCSDIAPMLDRPSGNIAPESGAEGNLPAQNSQSTAPAGDSITRPTPAKPGTHPDNVSHRPNEEEES